MKKVWFPLIALICLVAFLGCTPATLATVSVTGVSLSPKTLSLSVGGTPATLTATVSPSNATNQGLGWSSSAPSVATVSSGGVVSPVSVGSTTVTVTTADGGMSSSCQVTVSAHVAVTGVSLNNTTLSLEVGGGTSTLVATLAPSNASNKSVTWSSDAASVATVSSAGEVTPVAAGTATITVSTVDGSKKASCAVTVTASVTNSLAPSGIASSGATSVPTTLSETIADINAFGNADANTDPVIQDLGSAISSALSSSGVSTASLSPKSATTPLSAAFSKVLGSIKPRSLRAKDLSGDITTKLNAIQADINNFPTSKSLNESIDFSGDALGQYFTFTTAKAGLKASVVTTDGGPLDTVSNSNLSSAAAQATLGLRLDSNGLPAGDDIKYLSVRFNFGLNASVGSSTVNGTPTLVNLKTDYAESFLVAFSFNTAGSGGKVILTIDAKNTATIANPQTISSTDAENDLAPAISVTLSVYDDSNSQTFTQTWSDINTFMNDFNNPPS